MKIGLLLQVHTAQYNIGKVFNAGVSILRQNSGEELSCLRICINFAKTIIERVGWMLRWLNGISMIALDSDQSICIFAINYNHN